jgi:hypothetical protein
VPPYHTKGILDIQFVFLPMYVGLIKVELNFMLFIWFNLIQIDAGAMASSIKINSAALYITF